jgi:P27 family predicted phage terminase small subunit
LDKRHRFVYRKTRDQLREQNTWKDSDAPLLARYVYALQRAANARDQLEGLSVTVAGSKGQVVAHPLVRIIREAEQDADKRADMLLLSPAARQRADMKAPKGAGKLGL